MSLKLGKREDDFVSLLENLAGDLQAAHHRFKLLCGLLEQVGPYEREMNEALAFWSVTIESLKDAVLFRLCRIYDQNRGDTLHLRNWLQTIKDNMELFNTENFRVRLKGNPYVDSLALTARKPNVGQLDEDIAFASKESNPIVGKLYKLRCKVLAHKDGQWAIKGKEWLNDSSLNYEDIKSLLDKGSKIFNRYSLLFKATEYSSMLCGEGDYLTVLKDVREAHAHRNALIDEEIRQAEARQSKTP